MSGADRVRVSNPDKLFYPADGVTKGEVVAHYRAVAGAMVPHLRDRPLTLRRFPDGIEGQGWFQKEASGHFPDWVRVAEVPQRESGSVRHVLCQDADTLVYLANQGTIEFHIWNSTVDRLDRPDLLVLDLDPGSDGTVAELRALARTVRDRYRELGLAPYLQATGGRGFHVLAPLDGEADHDQVHELAREIADRLAAADPARLTTEHRKNKRGGRTFLDTNRNGYAQTLIAPYSLRSRPGAAAATPLDWAELGRAEPDGWDPERLRRRLARKQDPWRNLHRHAGSVAKALELLAGR